MNTLVLQYEHKPYDGHSWTLRKTERGGECRRDGVLVRAVTGHELERLKDEARRWSLVTYDAEASS